MISMQNSLHCSYNHTIFTYHGKVPQNNANESWHRQYYFWQFWERYCLEALPAYTCASSYNHVFISWSRWPISLMYIYRAPSLWLCFGWTVSCPIHCTAWGFADQMKLISVLILVGTVSYVPWHLKVHRFSKACTVCVSLFWMPLLIELALVNTHSPPWIIFLEGLEWGNP